MSSAMRIFMRNDACDVLAFAEHLLATRFDVPETAEVAAVRLELGRLSDDEALRGVPAEAVRRLRKAGLRIQARSGRETGERGRVLSKIGAVVCDTAAWLPVESPTEEERERLRANWTRLINLEQRLT